MNTVRRHLCLLKGGRLARLAHPARIVTLTLDTAPPGLPWPDLTAPDPTTFTDAVQVLQRYDLWTSVPRSVQRYLSRNVGRTEQETCVSLNGVCYRTYSVGSPADACQAAALCAQKLGYTPAVLSSSFSGEARELGIFLAGLCNEITRNSQPFSPPCALISGGETTVTFEKGRLFGQGGPNQETALAFARAVASGFPAVLVSLDTDGTDGPGQWAGGIVDDQTALAAAACGIDLDQVLSRHDAANALQSLNGAIVTGHTGTNVMNLRVLLIGAPPSHRQEA
jgi:glycerate-2-kinase